MSNVLIDRDKIDILANAISDKSGVPVTMTLDEMVEAVDGIEQIIPSGNINIAHSGVTDVTNYATATVPSADVGPYFSGNFFTQSNVRKWRANYGADLIDAGWLDANVLNSSDFNAIPKNTTVTPTTSAQTIGGANYMMEGAVTVDAVPSGSIAAAYVSGEYYTYGGLRYWEPTVAVELSGFFDQDYYEHDAPSFNAVPANTVITPTTSAQTVGGERYIMEGAVTVAAMPTGTAGTPTATKGSVSNHSISVTPSVTNTTGYITGSTKTGTAVTVSASELVSGTYTVDSSGTKDVTNYASASVPAGTAGTPSASKGAVSNHSISITPSVTNTTGFITGSTKTGTAVTVSASELVSGSQTITQNSTVDVTNLAEVVVSVEGGGGSGMTVATATATPSSASASISFTGLSGEPTSFAVISSADLATGASPYKTAAVVFDGSDLHGQTITNTSNAQVSYDGTHFSKTYSNGTLTITGSTYWQANQYTLVYTYGGSSANLGTADVQVGSGATSITFTGLTDEPDYFSCIFKSNFATSSGYQRVIAVAYDGNSTYGLAMDSGAKAETSWSYTYSNGSLTISSQSTSVGGYFHQPGYYQLTYGIGGTVEPTEIEVEPLSVTQNGTYTAPTGKAYSPVTVNVSGGSVNIDTKSMTNSSNQNTSISFSSMKGQPKAFFARCTSSLSRSSSNTYYYVADMVYDGTSTVGNMHARSNGQYSNITSGYSWSYSGTTLTLSSSGARNTSPGSFYNGTYELVYIY